MTNPTTTDLPADYNDDAPDLVKRASLIAPRFAHEHVKPHPRMEGRYVVHGLRGLGSFASVADAYDAWMVHEAARDEAAEEVA